MREEGGREGSKTVKVAHLSGLNFNENSQELTGYFEELF